MKRTTKEATKSRNYHSKWVQKLPTQWLTQFLVYCVVLRDGQNWHIENQCACSSVRPNPVTESETESESESQNSPNPTPNPNPESKVVILGVLFDF